MNVPPFVPPQIEIAGNVAEEPYAVRVAFLRRVVGLHSAYCAIVLGLSLIPLSAQPSLGVSLLIAALLGLSLVRGLAKGWRHEQVLSAICLPLLTASLVILVQFAVKVGWPFWIFGLAPLATLGYILLSGRDVSFAGMFVLTLVGCSAAILIGTLMQWLSTPMAFEAFLAIGIYLFFFTYDLAALQTRRRLGEEFGAVLDLFRDVLNFTTYPIRVVNHWRRHRIWSKG